MSLYIISDMDGVIANVVEEYIYRLWEEYNFMLPATQISTFNIEECVMNLGGIPGLSKEKLDRMTRSFWKTPAIYGFCRPNIYIWPALAKFNQKNPGKLRFMTSRDASSSIVEITKEWLTEYGLENVEVDFRKGPPGKAAGVKEFVESHPSDKILFMDDHSKIVDAVSLMGLYRGYDMKCVVVERPWSSALGKKLAGERENVLVMNEVALSEWIIKISNK